MASNLILSNVRPWGGPPSDVTISAGIISSIDQTEKMRGPALAQVGRDGSIVEGRGRLLLPSFTDAHVHLDSTRLGLPFRPHTGDRTLLGRIMNDRRNWREAGASVADRATYTLGELIRHGATRVRSYAQIDVDSGLERFEGVLAAREAHASRASVSIIAFPQAGIVRERGTAQLLESALRGGADIIGGIDPCALDGDPVEHLNVVFKLAEKYQVPVDIHLHEPSVLGLFSLRLVTERTRALSMQGRVTVSHAFSLGETPISVIGQTLDEIAELDIALTTIAPGGARPALPLERLVSAGIRVGLGQDGMRDYWSPFGNGDMLDRTWQLAFTSNFSRDDLIELTVAIATAGGASVLESTAPRLHSINDRPGLDVGDPAELVLVAGETVTGAVMDRLPDRTVIHAGEVVAEGLALTGVNPVSSLMGR